MTQPVTYPCSRPLAAYCDNWLKGRRLAPTTAAGYERSIRLHITPNIGHLAVSKVRASHLAALYRNLERNGSHSVRPGEKGRGLGPNTVGKVHSLLRTILEAAADDGELLTNPADQKAAEPPTGREIKQARPDITVWDEDQIQQGATWLKASKHRMAPMFYLLLYTGLRRGEVVGLRWSDLDMADQVLHVRRSVTRSHTKGSGSQINVGLPKSGKPRSLDLDDDTLAVLKAYRTALASEGFDRIAPSAPMFPNLKGHLYYPDAVYRIWDTLRPRIRTELNLPPPITVHEIRHSHATMLLRIGNPARDVQERLGHASSTITLDLYAHVTASSRRSLVDSIAQAKKTGSNQTGPSEHQDDNSPIGRLSN